MSGQQFGRKTYGRIFVYDGRNVIKLRDIIHALDEFEFKYMPEDFIAVYDSMNCPVVYGHKFELGMDRLRFACFKAGIPVMLVTNCEEMQDWRNGDVG